ncbi:hypothetical protein MNBD_ALPHA06-568 [hydrothermal vent metagenome]|uniref:Response regulatory domain-containing protein n=1 Tax=hydrothermal vent metagenome TaxID=652676 RepID=A0A3B0SUV8_9ZZZZ
MQYEEAQVCLFDAAHHNLMVTRASLVEIGFTKISLFTDFSEFTTAIAKTSYDLIIAEGHNAGGAIGDLMRKIRSGELGDNPFVVTLITSWARKSEHLQELVNAGIDDILLRPFSTSQLQSRLGALVSNRKEFVVTGDYVGPDRRSDASRKSRYIKTFKPPNTLRAVAKDEPVDDQEVKAEIVAMKENVTKERIRRLAMKIVVSMQLKLDDPVAAEVLDMEEIDGVARELRRKLRGHGVPDAVELARALTEITTDLTAPGEHDQSQYKLVRELALGAYTAFADGESVETEDSEVQNTVNNLRNKLQERVISGFSSAQA